MAQTIELPDGTKITTPTEARLAEAPPPPNGAAAPEPAGDLEGRVAALEEAMTAVVQQLQSMMQASIAAMEASVPSLPPVEGDGRTD